MDEFVLAVSSIETVKSRNEADNTDGGGTGRGDTNTN